MHLIRCRLWNENGVENLAVCIISALVFLNETVLFATGDDELMLFVTSFGSFPNAALVCKTALVVVMPAEHVATVVHFS